MFPYQPPTLILRPSTLPLDAQSPVRWLFYGPVSTYFVLLRYCLFGLNVGLTEKFEANSKPMRIHVSEPCKNLLPAQFKFEQRDDPEVKEKVGGLNSYFLNSKDGR